ncbi:MAG: 16S rRNA processing protein RimM, partial [Clostridia bacterium]|nr:16S rRNA processing protein RimM [Clostridia bacterium]
MEEPDMLSEYLMIGEITKPQGVRGEVKVRPCTCDPDRFDGLETVYIK